MQFKFKELEIKQERKGIKSFFQSQRTKKTLLFMGIGMVAGALYFYFTEGQQMDSFSTRLMIKHALIGGFFGFFFSNSPCANNRC